MLMVAGDRGQQGDSGMPGFPGPKGDQGSSGIGFPGPTGQKGALIPFLTTGTHHRHFIHTYKFLEENVNRR